MDEEALFQQALQEADAELAGKAEERAILDRAELDKVERNSGGGTVERTLRSAALGVAKAGIETKDFLVGEPEEGDKSDFRQSIESQDRALDAESMGYSLTSGVSQIATGLIGAGKVLGPIKLLKKGRAAFEVARGMVAGAVAVDPHEERLSDLIESFPDLQNPVTDYLAADPDDSAAEGRFKNALESLGLDLTLMTAIKAIKFLKGGKQEAAQREIAKLNRARTANEAEFGLDFGPTPKDIPDARSVPADTPATGADVPPGGAGSVPGRVPQVAGRQDAPVASEGKEVVREQLGTRTPIDPKTGQQVIPEEVKPADVFKVQEVTDDQIDDILKGSKADSSAITKYGSRQAAAEAGHKFGPTAKLPWQKLRGTTEVQAFLQQSSKVLKAQFDKAKGGSILSDKRVKDLTDELAEAYGEDPAMILGQITRAGEAGAQMVANMEVALRVGNKMFMDADELATKIRTGQLDEYGGNVGLATEELKARVAAAVDVMSSGASILSNSGRALRRARTQFRLRPKDIDTIKNIDPERLHIIMEKANGDPRKIAMLANQTWAKRVMDETTWHITNGLLWLWPTHTVNTTTNGLMLLGRPTEKLFGSAALRLITKDPIKRAELSSVSRQAMREFHYTFASLADGWTNAVEAFRRGDSILNPHNTEYFDSGAGGIGTQPLPWKPVNSVWDLAQNAWMSASYRTLAGLPTRTLGGADEFFKQLRYRAVVQSRASVEASERGLIGQAFTSYIQKSLDQAIDPETGRALDAAATREAQTVSFQQDLNHDTWVGSAGLGIQNFRKTFRPAEIILPFVKTPMNVLRYGIKLTPGLNILQKEFNLAIRGKNGAEAQAHAMGQMALGSMFMGLAASMALEGRFTGSGPDDYKLKQELLATGWKPYSFVWQDEAGDTKYFQLGRFDPVATAMGMVSDIVHLQQKNPDQDYSDLIMSVAVAVAKNLGEKTFLLNLNSVMEAGLDPEKRLPKFAGRTVGSALPFSSLLRGHNPDPYLREARGFVDSAMRGVPGLSQTLPLSMDVFGDPIERYVGLMDTQKGGDIVEAEHNRIMLQTDSGLGKPGTKIGDVDLRDLTLKDGKNAYQRLQELSGHLPKGPSLKEMLAKVIKSDAYQDLPDGDAGVSGTRLNRLGKVVQQYREQAKKVFLRENPELQPLIKQRQRDARGAAIINRQERLNGGSGAKDILKATGYL